MLQVSGQDAIKRIVKIKKEIDELYQDLKETSIVEFAFEDIQMQDKKDEHAGGLSFGKPQTEWNDNIFNVKTFKSLAWLQGVLFTYCQENYIKYNVIHSQT